MSFLFRNVKPKETLLHGEAAALVWSEQPRGDGHHFASVSFPACQSQGASVDAAEVLQWEDEGKLDGLRAELIDDWDGVRALAPEWKPLLAQSKSDTIYLTWEWIHAWEKVVGRAHEPFVIAVRDTAGTLCGLAPFYLCRYNLLGTVPVRMLRFVGDHPTGAEYADWILRRDCEEAAARAIALELRRSRQWDALWLPQVSGWSGARERIQPACEGAGLHCVERPAEFGHIPLPASIEAYDAALSDNRRKQFRSQRNKVLRKGGAVVTRCETREELPGYLDALFDLHGRRRRALGEQGSFDARPEEARFYREFAQGALEKGWLWISALRDRGEIKAIQLGYVYGGAFHQLQEGFDPQYTAGAGNVLRYEVIRECIEAGVTSYDFLGGYTEHKRRWLAEPRAGHDLFIGRRGLLNRAMFAVPVWPTGRYLKPS
jgi:CelD/BcsL family acetyltransferase involved in cellulose biosynthesis